MCGSSARLREREARSEADRQRSILAADLRAAREEINAVQNELRVLADRHAEQVARLRAEGDARLAATTATVGLENAKTRETIMEDERPPAGMRCLDRLGWYS